MTIIGGGGCQNDPHPRQAAGAAVMQQLERYCMICRQEAPYPLNYLPSSPDNRDKVLGAMVGMMIDKGYFIKAMQLKRRSGEP